MRVSPIDAAEAAATQAATGRRPSRSMLVIAALFIAVAAAMVWWLWRAPAISVVRITRGSAAEIVYATGAVEPETWSRSTPLDRGRIIERCRCEGKIVKAGDILARLDDKEALATLNDLRALEEFQRLEFDRQAQLLARGIATSQAYQKAESDLARNPGADRGPDPAVGILQAGGADGRHRTQERRRGRRHGRSRHHSPPYRP